MVLNKMNLIKFYFGFVIITSVSESTVVVASVVAVASIGVEEVESLEVVDTA